MRLADDLPPLVPKVEKIRGLNLTGTPRATSACHGIPLLYITVRRLFLHTLVLIRCHQV